MNGRNGQREENPITAAVKRSLQGRQPTVVLDVIKAMPAGAMPKFIERKFSEETIREIGILIIESLLLGDRRMVKTVKDAIKEADHIFNRDREPELLRKALVYLKFCGGHELDAAAFRRAIEQRFNNGQRLPQYRWNRVRKALGLAKVPAGKARI